MVNGVMLPPPCTLADCSILASGAQTRPKEELPVWDGIGQRLTPLELESSSWNYPYFRQLGGSGRPNEVTCQTAPGVLPVNLPIVHDVLPC